MSFRIEDILRKEDRRAEEAPRDSILEQTLVSSAYKQPISDLYSGKLYSSWYNCDRIFVPAHCEAYVEKASPYMALYPRRIWPPYSSIPFVMPYHYSNYSKRKGGQVRFTAGQTDALEKRFTSNKYLSPEDRRLLADSLKLTDRQVKTWFQNRRAKWRRCNSSVTNNTSENQDSESDTEICDTSQNDSPEMKN